MVSFEQFDTRQQRRERIAWWLSAPLVAFCIALFTMLLVAYVWLANAWCPAPECAKDPAACNISLEDAAADRAQPQHRRNSARGLLMIAGCP
jgi:hypothetical protein